MYLNLMSIINIILVYASFKEKIPLNSKSNLILMKSLLILEGIVGKIEKVAKVKNREKTSNLLTQYKRAEEVYIERFGYQPIESKECYRTVEQIKNADLSDFRKKEAYQILENKKQIINILLTPLRKRISVAKNQVKKKNKKQKNKKTKKQS